MLTWKMISTSQLSVATDDVVENGFPAQVVSETQSSLLQMQQVDGSLLFMYYWTGVVHRTMAMLVGSIPDRGDDVDNDACCCRQHHHYETVVATAAAVVTAASAAVIFRETIVVGKRAIGSPDATAGSVTVFKANPEMSSECCDANDDSHWLCCHHR